VAACELVDARLEATAYGEQQDLGACVALAEQANTVAPSSSSAGTLVGALLHRAAQRLGATQPGFAELWQRHQRWQSSSALFAIAAGADAKARSAIAADPDVQRAVGISVTKAKAIPGAVSAAMWALAAAVDAAAGQVLAEGIRHDDFAAADLDLDVALSPMSPSVAVEAYFHHRLLGDEVPSAGGDRRVRRPGRATAVRSQPLSAPSPPLPAAAGRLTFRLPSRLETTACCW